MPYNHTYIDLNQLRKAKKPFNLDGRKIILMAYGKELPITGYLETHFDKLRKYKDKQEYLDYINQHNELEIFMRECL